MDMTTPPGGPGGLRPVRLGDAPGIAEIYNHYITHTIITFEEEALSPRIMEDRIREVIPRFPWFVWEEGGELAGYAYAHAWHQRAAYRFAAEDSVYLKPGWERRGIGTKLLQKVLGELRSREFHAVMAAITVPIGGSVGLHESLGFKKTGQFNQIGYKLGSWLDVGYWELILDDGIPAGARKGDPAEGGIG
jgi:phosphinothricin acetyltransferase